MASNTTNTISTREAFEITIRGLESLVAKEFAEVEGDSSRLGGHMLAKYNEYAAAINLIRSKSYEV